MNHRKQNSRKQHERKFDRKGVRQLSQVVTEETTAMQAELQALKMMVEAIIRVQDIDQAVVRQMRRDAKARGEEDGNDPAPVVGEIRPRSWWRRLFGTWSHRKPAGLTTVLPGDIDPNAPLSPAAELELQVAVLQEAGKIDEADQEPTN